MLIWVWKKQMLNSLNSINKLIKEKKYVWAASTSVHGGSATSLAVDDIVK